MRLRDHAAPKRRPGRGRRARRSSPARWTRRPSASAEIFCRATRCARTARRPGAPPSSATRAVSPSSRRRGRRAGRTGRTSPQRTPAERAGDIERGARERRRAGDAETGRRRHRGMRGTVMRVSFADARSVAAAGAGAASRAARIAGTSRRSCRDDHRARAPGIERAGRRFRAGRRRASRGRDQRTTARPGSQPAGGRVAPLREGSRARWTGPCRGPPPHRAGLTSRRARFRRGHEHRAASVTPRTTSVAPGTGGRRRARCGRAAPRRRWSAGGAATAGRPRHRRDHEAGEQGGGRGEGMRHGYPPGQAYLPPVFRTASTLLRHPLRKPRPGRPGRTPGRTSGSCSPWRGSP